MDIRDSVSKRLTHEILFTKKTEEEIIEGIVEETYLSKWEVSLMYVEALQDIVDIVKKVGETNSEKKEKELTKKRKRK